MALELEQRVIIIKYGDRFRLQAGAIEAILPESLGHGQKRYAVAIDYGSSRDPMLYAYTEGDLLPELSGRAKGDG